MLDFFLKWRINNAFKKNKRKRAFLNMESMNKILILFTIEDWNEISLIAKNLRIKGKEVILWTVSTKKVEDGDIIYPSNVRIISSKHTSKFLGLSSVVVNEFKALSYDTLIDLSISENETLGYLLGINAANFCIGIKESEHKIYDFIVLKEADKGLVETYEQIKFYLNNIR